MLLGESNDYIRLANTYADTVRKSSNHVTISSAGSGNHIISPINPRISAYRGNTLRFDVEDSSLVDLTIHFYTDSDFVNEYSTATVSRTGDPGTSGAVIDLPTDAGTLKSYIITFLK